MSASYILGIAIETYECALSGIQVLGCGDGGREEGEGTAQDFEARIYSGLLAELFVLLLVRVAMPALELAPGLPSLVSKLCCGSDEDEVAAIWT